MNLQSVAKDADVELLRWSFSEPQTGKSGSDRKAAVVKERLRAFVDDRHDVTSEEDVFTGLTVPDILPHATIVHAEVEILEKAEPI
uniref:Uncharacterized protein n=1 Tax=Panagrolaimus superbus TaxID=310955 RepID=A0A914Y724_9BILA